MRALNAGLLTIAIALPATARADYIPPCSPPSAMEQIAFQDLPEDLADALRRDAGPFVGPAAKFDSTDVVLTHVNRRIIFIWRGGNDWIIATEHGGLGYNDPVFHFKRGVEVKMIRSIAAFPRTVCHQATMLAESLEAQGTSPEL